MTELDLFPILAALCGLVRWEGTRQEVVIAVLINKDLVQVADGFKGCCAVDDQAWGLKVRSWYEGGARARGQTSLGGRVSQGRSTPCAHRWCLGFVL